MKALCKWRVVAGNQLQGPLFRKLRNIIMGLAALPEEERVINSENMSNMSSRSNNEPRTQRVINSNMVVVHTMYSET